MMNTGIYTIPQNKEWIQPIIDHFNQEFERETYNDLQKIESILLFITRNFGYKIDKKNSYWQEKSMYPEEVLYFKYGDCEDFSFLFGYLLIELTHLELLYLQSRIRRHVTIVVKLDTPIGIQYIYHNKKYTVIDPTDRTIGYGDVLFQNDYSILWDPNKEKHK